MGAGLFYCTQRGLSYESYVQANVLKPLGITQMRLGRTSRSLRAENEASYVSGQIGVVESVVDPSEGLVAPPYGAWSLELMAANGGWLANATDLVRFASAFDRPDA